MNCVKQRLRISSADYSEPGDPGRGRKSTRRKGDRGWEAPDESDGVARDAEAVCANAATSPTLHRSSHERIENDDGQRGVSGVFVLKSIWLE
jgi:hypothetical protein